MIKSNLHTLGALCRRHDSFHDVLQHVEAGDGDVGLRGLLNEEGGDDGDDYVVQLVGDTLQG